MMEQQLFRLPHVSWFLIGTETENKRIKHAVHVFASTMPRCKPRGAEKAAAKLLIGRRTIN